jgi:hypothetical protein
MPSESSSSENKNTKYSICVNTNIGIMAAEATEAEEAMIEYNGKSYSSLEAFDANEMPRDVFMGKKNVVMAYAGTKVSNGVDTGEPCVVIGVKRKIPKDLIAEEDVIPDVLPDGVITDVIECPEIMALGTCTGGAGGGCPDHDIKYRPLQGGISAIEDGATACTLGVIVKDSTDGRLVALTNNHCAGLQYDPAYKVPTNGNLSAAGIDMLQPSPNDGGTNPADVYGTVKRAVSMEFGTDSIQDNIVDCAISTIATDDASTPILDLHEGPFPFATSAEYGVGTEVVKSGRTTGNTPPPTTTITSTNANVNVSYGAGDENLAPFSNQIIYTAATRFSQGGDSGSAALAVIGGEYKIIGLHFAGNGTGTLGVACHIENVASELGVEEWNGDIVVANNFADSISVNGVCYERVGGTEDDITHTVGATHIDCEDCANDIYSSSSSSDQSSSSSSPSSPSSKSSSSSSSSISESSSKSSSSSPSSPSSSSSKSDSTVQKSTSSESTPSSESTLQKSTSSDSSGSSESSIKVKSSSTVSESESSASSSDSSESPSSSSSSLEVPPGFEDNPVENLILVDASVSGVVINWSEYDSADGYIVERKLGFSDWEEVATTTETTYVDNCIEPGQFFTYRVRAFNANALTGVIVYSLFATLDYIIFSPVAPENLNLLVRQDAVRLSWLDKSTYEDGFVIERKKGTGDFESLYFTKSNRDFFVDEGVFETATYTYRVRSYVILPNEKYLYSPASNEVSVDIDPAALATDGDSVLYIEFGQEVDQEVDISSATRVFILNPEDVEHDWSANNSKTSLQPHNIFADMFALETGETRIVSKSEESDDEAVLNLIIERPNIDQSPEPPVNLRGMAANNSSITISWNDVSESRDQVSHYDIYRVKRENSSSALDLVSFEDLAKNRIASVPNRNAQIFNYTDFGLISGTRYIYLVAAVSKFGRTSLLNGEIPYDYIGENDFITVSTTPNDIDIDPALAFVSPNASGYLGIINNSSDELGNIDWQIESGNSGSNLRIEGQDYVYYEASDKALSSDMVKSNTDIGSARSKVIVTEVV